MRLRPPVLLAVLALTLPACGDDGDGDRSPGADRAALKRSGPLPSYTLTQAETALEVGTGLALVRTGGEAGVASDVEPAPVDSVRYEEQGGREFDLLVFATSAQARRARASVRATEAVRDGGAYSQAANLIAVTPEPPRRGVYERVFAAMRALATRERDGAAPPRPEGGSLTDQALDIGEALELGGITYDVSLARQLNPAIEPDAALVEGDPAPGDRLLFGVFLRTCNEQGDARRTSDDVRLRNAFGEGVAPSSGAAETFAYRPRTLAPGRCAPPEDSVPEQVIDGSLLLFAVPRGFFQDRPLLLEVRAGGRRGLMTLDV